MAAQPKAEVSPTALCPRVCIPFMQVQAVCVYVCVLVVIPAPRTTSAAACPWL